jgi:hypothetical protein
MSIYDQSSVSSPADAYGRLTTLDEKIDHPIIIPRTERPRCTVLCSDLNVVRVYEVVCGVLWEEVAPISQHNLQERTF